MATSMTTYRTLRDAHREAREAVENSISDDGQEATVYVLRRDGDTDIFRAVPAIHGGHAIFRVKAVGWLTRGMCLSPTDMPCIVWG